METLPESYVSKADCGRIDYEDVSNKSKTIQNGRRCIELLDLSDDVLLCILKYCAPMDLKALGFSCERLGNLVCDHTLWQTVDARGTPCGTARLKWFLIHGLNTGTKKLMVSGFARHANGIQKDNGEVKQVTEEKNEKEERNEKIETPPPADPKEDSDYVPVTPECVSRQHALFHFAPRQVPRWASIDDDSSAEDEAQGHQFTFTKSLYEALKIRCPNLTSLALDYCNITYCPTFLSQLPPTVKKLSLRGTRIFKLPVDKSILYNIKGYLPELEYLDLSECRWLEPRLMLTLSKIVKLTHLLMQNCIKMREFVAYASLATRYGFCNLEVLDLRGTPVGDSEVSALGWLPKLQELYLSPCSESALNSEGETDKLKQVCELESWEADEPYYYKSKSQDAEIKISDDEDPANSNTWMPMNLDVENFRADVPDFMDRQNDTSNIDDNADHATSRNNNRCRENGGPSRKRKKRDTEKKCDEELQTIHTVKYNEQRNVNENNESEINENNKNSDPETSVDVNTKSVHSFDVIVSTSADAKINNSLSNNDCEMKEKLPSNHTSDNDESELKGDINHTLEFPLDMPGTSKTVTINEQVNISECVRNVKRKKNSEPRQSESNNEASTSNHNGHDPQIQQNRMFPNVLCVNLGTRRTDLSNNNSYDIIAGPGLDPSFYNFSMQQRHINPTALVTDSAIRRFGRADGDVNLMVIEYGGPALNITHNARPDRSNLRVLSVTGYEGITNSSLVHLASAAPHLRLIDFSGTRVNAAGVEIFRGLRPDCEVIFTDDSD